jgi:uncharacterized integral membrane protein (TIGR00697 family)
MNLNNKKDIVFLVLAGFFITNAIVAELIGGKLVMFFGTFVQSVGIVLWPVVFILTDIVNEFYGQNGVKKLSYVTLFLIAFTFLYLFICIHIPAVAFSPVSDENFKKVFGQSMYIMVGSMVAFMVSQLVDSGVFWMLRNRTGKKMIWLRSTGSTVVSQLVDTFIVQFIAFVVPGVWTFKEFLHNASYGYVFKLFAAICVIPVIYLVHYLIDRYLGEEQSEEMVQHTAEKNLHRKIQK